MDINDQATPTEVPATKENTPKTWGRRELLKALAATGGAVALSNVPNKWDKPEVGFGVLPAHAQASLTAAEYSTFCDSTPGGGDITLALPTGTGQINNITANLVLLSGPGNVDNVTVTMDFVPQAPATAADFNFVPALPRTAVTNSSGVASFGNLAITGTADRSFDLTFTYANPNGTVPDSLCGLYDLH